jgi:hypothetical protein
MNVDLEQAIRRMQEKGWNITVHPRDCGGKCASCKRMMHEFASAIAREEDEHVLDAINNRT